MPTYRNDTEGRITHADMSYMSWMPGEVHRLGFFVPHEKLGLTLVSDDPRPDFAVYDWTVELTALDPADVVLKYFEAFELSIYAVSGSAKVYIGTNATPIGVSAGESHVGEYSYARCPSLRFFSEESAVLRVKQEERNTRNMIRRRAY
jgi:hypothetical protein